MLQRVVKFWNPPVPVGQDISVSREVPAHTVGTHKIFKKMISNENINFGYMTYMCTYDFCYHLFDFFFYSKSVSEYDTQSKKFFIDQNFETSLEMKKTKHLESI